MKKLFILVCLLFLTVSVPLGASFLKKERADEAKGPIIQNEEADDILVLNQEDIMIWIENMQEKIELELKEDQIDAKVELSDELFEQLPIKNSIKEVLALFKDESLACRFLFENKQLIVESCNIKGITIPESLYHDEMEILNESIAEQMEKYGIDEIKICDESIRIQGDISSALKQAFLGE